jgi:hypothetical protein
MAQKKLQLRPLVVTIAVGSPIKVQIDELLTGSNDFDDTTVLALQALVKPTAAHPGSFSRVGQFTKGATTMTGIYYSAFGSNGANFKSVTYTPQEKGLHSLVLTGVEGNVGHTYRTTFIRVV